MTVLDAPEPEEDLPFPEDEDEVTAAEDEVVVLLASLVALDSDWTAFPPPLLPLEAERTTEEDASDAEVVVDEPFEPLPPFPLFPVALAVELEKGAIVPEAADELVETVSATSEEVLETDAALLSATSGPAATALAARAAAANPPVPEFDAALAVVPDPMTVNFVQSSAVPR